MKTKKTYILIYQEETDGDIKEEILTKKEIIDKIKNYHYSDYSIIDGNIIKSFSDKFIITHLK